MGNCVLVRRDQKSDSRFKWLVGSKAFVSVPITQPNTTIVWEKEIGRKFCSSPLSSPPNHLATSPDFGKGDEVFFDSHAWLDSDNEDFFSVNGDNTPSCSSTPKWHPNAIETPSCSRTPEWHPSAIETPPIEQSPKEIKKQLIELFRESFNREQENSSMANTTTGNHLIELVNKEVNNNKAITSGRSRSAKEKSAQSTPCCIPVPKMARSLSLSDKKRRLLSPCHGGGRVDL